MTAIRKHWKDFAAIIVLVVIAFAVAIPILSKQRLALPGWVPVVGTDTPWRAGCVLPAIEIDRLNSGFCAGQRPSGGTTLTIEQSRGLQHGIRPASTRLEHFGCYTAPTGKGFRARKVTLSDQFGRRVAKVRRGLTLCAPAQKNDEAAVVNTRDHLRCYATNRGRCGRPSLTSPSRWQWRSRAACESVSRTGFRPRRS